MIPLSIMAFFYPLHFLFLHQKLTHHHIFAHFYLKDIQAFVERFAVDSIFGLRCLVLAYHQFTVNGIDAYGYFSTQIFIHFDGQKTCCGVWIDGKWLGY